MLPTLLSCDGRILWEALYHAYCNPLVHKSGPYLLWRAASPHPELCIVSPAVILFSGFPPARVYRGKEEIPLLDKEFEHCNPITACHCL